MTGKDILIMRPKELKRSQIIAGVLEKKYKQIEAAKILDLSDRQVRRIAVRVKQEGDGGIFHRLRGRRSNRAYAASIRDKILGIYAKKYKGFGPTLASEKLEEHEHIRINDETLRLWLLKTEAWQIQRKVRKHRAWRERKAYFGEMVQMDGSHHDWLEGRGPYLVLMGYIDDATGTVYGKFYDYEGTMPALESFRCYIKRYGIPASIYFDKHSTYMVSGKQAMEDELCGREGLTQFGRALKELGVELIHANSPQAKGRVERLFRTFQDRLVKEMRLEGIKSKEEANKFLGVYLEKYNQRFRVEPREHGNMHRKIPEGLDLERILCRRTDRPLRNDFTVIHDKKTYQVLDKTKAMRVTMEERLNGKLLITYKGQRLKHKEIPMQLFSPPRKLKPKPINQNVRVRPYKPYKPPKDHPWRGAGKPKGLKEKEAKRKGLWKLMDNPSGYPQLPQYGGYQFHQLKKIQKPDISTLVKTGHF